MYYWKSVDVHTASRINKFAEELGGLLYLSTFFDIS